MSLYFFDTHDDDEIMLDDIGTECTDLKSVEIEVARGLAELAREVLPGSSRRKLAIDVRDDQGPVMIARMTFEAVNLRASG